MRRRSCVHGKRQDGVLEVPLILRLGAKQSEATVASCRPKATRSSEQRICGIESNTALAHTPRLPPPSPHSQLGVVRLDMVPETVL